MTYMSKYTIVKIQKPNKTYGYTVRTKTDTYLYLTRPVEGEDVTWVDIENVIFYLMRKSQAVYWKSLLEGSLVKEVGTHD